MKWEVGTIMKKSTMMSTLLVTFFALSLVFSATAFAGPAITSIAPNTAGANSGILEITDLAGTDFVDGATVALIRDTEAPGQAPILLLPAEGSSTLVVSSAKIVGVFFFEGAAPGTYDVRVTNPDGQSATLTDGFTVTE
jgi:hypothetical protein